jgi:hypothetical protein
MLPDAPEPNQAPAGDHIPDTTKMVPAGDGEREELARLLTADAECLEADEPNMMSIDNHQLRRAAALLRQPAPEPSQAPAGDGGLREVVKRTMRAQDLRGWDEVSRAVILAVAKWLRSRGNHYAATELEREAQR